MKILITNCTRNSALIILRRLVRNGHEVIAADNRKLPLGMHSRYVRSYELLPHESAPNFIHELISLIRKHKPDVILPSAGAEIVCRERETFLALSNVLVPSVESYLAVHNKKNILLQCKKAGVPHSKLIGNIEMAEKMLEQKRVSSVVVKPYGNLGGGRGIQIVSRSSAIRSVCHQVEKLFGNYVICEYIPGPDINNYALHVVFDAESNPVCQFTFQKLRLSPSITGVTAVAISKHMPELLKLVLPMLHDLKWKGPADIEFKLDSRDQKLKLIEINARFSGAIGFAIACGVDMPELTCQAALCRNIQVIEENAFVDGVKYWNPPQYFKSVFVEWVKSNWRISVLNNAINELNGSLVGSPYEISDPAPMIGKALYPLVQALDNNKFIH